MTNLETAMLAFSELTTEERKTFITHINSVMKTEREIKALEVKLELRTGMTVKFHSKKYDCWLRGELIKINRTTAEIQVPLRFGVAAGNWTVGISQLKKVE